MQLSTAVSPDLFFPQHLNSPRHNINYADNMTKSNETSGGCMAADAHQINNIPMLNMFLQTLQPPPAAAAAPPAQKACPHLPSRKGRGGWQHQAAAAGGGKGGGGHQPSKRIRDPAGLPAAEVER